MAGCRWWHPPVNRAPPRVLGGARRSPDHHLPTGHHRTRSPDQVTRSSSRGKGLPVPAHPHHLWNLWHGPGHRYVTRSGAHPDHHLWCGHGRQRGVVSGASQVADQHGSGRYDQVVVASRAALDHHRNHAGTCRVGGVAGTRDQQPTSPPHQHGPTGTGCRRWFVVTTTVPSESWSANNPRGSAGPRDAVTCLQQHAVLVKSVPTAFVVALVVPSQGGARGRLVGPPWTVPGVRVNMPTNNTTTYAHV